MLDYYILSQKYIFIIISLVALYATGFTQTPINTSERKCVYKNIIITIFSNSIHFSVGW